MVKGDNMEFTKLEMELLELIMDALYTDGAHHKQWYLEQLLSIISKDGYIPMRILNVAETWEPGVAP
tara:strand:- start:144 stop:344 length:201 start_codon:yes stop_codon:yes gene_type:complete